MANTTFELQALKRKSFNGKAIVTVENDISTLASYSTPVATYNHKTNEMIVNGWFSNTTARHINAFLSLKGFNTCTKKELETYND